MKNILYISLLIIGSSVAFGQVNLVPNGDFELGPSETSEDWANAVDINCIIGGVVGGPTSWVVTNSSPDRLYEGDIPCNWDPDTAAFGNAYVMLGYGSIGESGKATLLTPLMVDSAYELSYYVQLETAQSSTIIPSRISFLFNNSGDSINSPWVSDSSNWQRIDTTFIATSNSSEIEISNTGGLSYGVKLDSISLTKTSIATLPILFYKNKTRIFPNPTKSGLISVEVGFTDKVNYILLNSLGVPLENGYFQNSKVLNISDIDKGMYLIRFNVDDKIFTRKIIYN